MASDTSSGGSPNTFDDFHKRHFNTTEGGRRPSENYERRNERLQDCWEKIEKAKRKLFDEPEVKVVDEMERLSFSDVHDRI
jgi:hypothetical protein